jgi:hypothetical protein
MTRQSVSVDRFKPRPPKTPRPPKVPSGLGKRATPQQVTRAPVRMYGPKIFKRFAELLPATDWSVPPTGFPAGDLSAAHVSSDEWMFYAAISLVKNDPPDPRQGPWTGGSTWTYQEDIGGGRLMRGGQVCDYAIHTPGQPICIRLQTERYHIMTKPQKIQQDLDLKVSTLGYKLVDVFSQEFVADKSLRSACRIAANILNGRETLSPALFGTSRRVRK